jgi:hypothetical protein
MDRKIGAAAVIIGIAEIEHLQPENRIEMHMWSPAAIDAHKKHKDAFNIELLRILLAVQGRTQCTYPLFWYADDRSLAVG